MVFPVVMYGCETWTIKKAEHWRIDAFELWCTRRLLRVPWTARRSNLSILKINPGCSLEGLMLKLKLQYFGHLMWRTDSSEKILMLGKIEGRRRRGRQRMRWMDGITDSMDMSLGRLRELVMDKRGLACCSSWGCKESDTNEWLNWTELKWEDPIGCGATKPVSHTIEACKPKPVLHKRSHHNEKPVHWDEEQPPPAATRESPWSATKTQSKQE